MSVQLISTVADEARELVSLGPDAITRDTPLSVLVYMARRYAKDQAAVRARQSAREAEAVARAELRRAPRRSSAVVEDDLRRAMVRKAYVLLYGKSFTPAVGETVTWGEATREQHQRRIDSQNELAAGIQDDIDSHLEAIAVLDEFGIDRLADL